MYLHRRNQDYNYLLQILSQLIRSTMIIFVNDISIAAWYFLNKTFLVDRQSSCQFKNTALQFSRSEICLGCNVNKVYDEGATLNVTDHYWLMNWQNYGDKQVTWWFCLIIFKVDDIRLWRYIQRWQLCIWWTLWSIFYTASLRCSLIQTLRILHPGLRDPVHWLNPTHKSYCSIK